MTDRRNAPGLAVVLAQKPRAEDPEAHDPQDSDDPLLAAAQELLDAIHRGDTEAIAEALDVAYGACSDRSVSPGGGGRAP